MKKVIMLTLALVLMFTLSGCAIFAIAPRTSEPSAEPAETVEPDEPAELAPATGEELSQVAKYKTYTGVIDKIDGSAISLKDGDSETVNVIINATDKTLYFDAATGEASSFEAVKAGDRITVSTESIVALSSPPQAAAVAIFTNQAKDATVPKLANVVKIEEQQDGATWYYTNINAIWIVTGETPLVSLADGEATINEGTLLIGWYDIETRSFPSQAHPDRVVVVE